MSLHPLLRSLGTVIAGGIVYNNQINCLARQALRPDAFECSFDRVAVVVQADGDVDFCRWARLVLVVPENFCWWFGCGGQNWRWAS